MSVTRKALAGLIAATLLATSATPAMARGWGGYHGGYRHHHHGGGNVAGALIGGLVIGGAVAAIATAVDNDNERRAYAYDRGYAAAPVYVERVPAPVAPRGQDRIASQGEAVDACSIAAEDEARGGRVNDITRAQRWADGWQVEGVLDRGGTDAAGYRALDRFSCSVRYGQIEDVRIGGDAIAFAR